MVITAHSVAMNISFPSEWSNPWRKSLEVGYDAAKIDDFSTSLAIDRSKEMWIDMISEVWHAVTQRSLFSEMGGFL